jgi:hypothetical protein
MRDKFATLDGPRRPALIGAVFVALVIAGIFFAVLTWQARVPTRHTGFVRSVEVLAASRLNGGSRPIASVMLDNGAVITGYIDRGAPVSPGDQVVVWEHARHVGGSVYEVAGRVKK